jgi:hypothetical protein
MNRPGRRLARRQQWRELRQRLSAYRAYVANLAGTTTWTRGTGESFRVNLTAVPTPAAQGAVTMKKDPNADGARLGNYVIKDIHDKTPGPIHGKPQPPAPGHTDIGGNARTLVPSDGAPSAGRREMPDYDGSPEVEALIKRFVEEGDAARAQFVRGFAAAHGVAKTRQFLQTGSTDAGIDSTLSQGDVDQMIKGLKAKGHILAAHEPSVRACAAKMGVAFAEETFRGFNALAGHTPASAHKQIQAMAKELATRDNIPLARAYERVCDAEEGLVNLAMRPFVGAGGGR